MVDLKLPLLSLFEHHALTSANVRLRRWTEFLSLYFLGGGQFYFGRRTFKKTTKHKFYFMIIHMDNLLLQIEYEYSIFLILSRMIFSILNTPYWILFYSKFNTYIVSYIELKKSST